MPEQKRHDPPSRPVDGALNDQALLKHQDPNRSYCLANPNDFHTGVSWMQRLGWIVETHRKDGPRVVGGDTAKDGDVLTIAGDVLMSIPRAIQEERMRSGWAVADARAQAIGQRGGIDGLVGPTGRPAEWKEDPREFLVRG